MLLGDKGYDTKEFVQEMRGINATPHVAQNDGEEASRQARSGYTTSTLEALLETRSTPSSSEAKHRDGPAGSKPWACCARHDIVESREWDGCSPSQLPPITWCGCGI